MKSPGLSRRTIGLIVALCAAVVGSVAWSLVLRAPSAPPVPIERKLMAQRPRPVEPEILRVPPREMRAVIRDDALLKPDRRFVLAFEDVASLEGARPEGGAKVSSRDRRWTIDAGGGIRAELSDIPGFFEALDALRGAARARVPAGGKKVAASETRRLRGLASDPFEGRAMGTLREIDTLWNAGFDRTELLDLASLAFVTLELGTIDSLEMGDVVGGRAFALLALAEAAGKTRLPAREALLAYALGYAGEARRFAQDLPRAEQIRPFFLEADDELKAVAEGAASSPVVRYLYALRLAPKANVADVFDWLSSHGAPRAGDPAVIAAALRAKDVFDHELRLNSTLMMAGWAEAGGKEEQPGPGLLASFERTLAANGRKRGRFFDDAAAVAQTRAVFYSGLFGIGSFYLDALKAVAADSGADEWKQIRAIEYLDSLEAIDHAAFCTSVLGVLSRKPKDATAMSCVRMLWENGFLKEAEVFLRRWLETHPVEHVLTVALYASRLEHVLFLDGRFEEAWRTIEPFVSTGKADALEAGAEALEGLGRHEDARAMSAGALERYPDGGWTRSGHAQLLWRQGRFDEVPKVLLDSRHPLNPQDWNEAVVRDFYDVFGKKGPVEARKAFDALLRGGVNPWFLFSFAEPFAKHKQYDTAIDLLDAVVRMKNERIDGNLREYRFRVRRDGHEGANRWFRSEVVGSASASWVGQKAFDVHEFELLWLLPDSDSHWLLRAQAAAFEGGPGETRKQALAAHFRDPKTPRTDALDGLFLLGLETEDHLFESATNAGRRCDVAFVLGLKAVGEKRLEDACDWLRVCQKTGSSARPSYKGADGLLKFWDVRRFGRHGGRDIP